MWPLPLRARAVAASSANDINENQVQNPVHAMQSRSALISVLTAEINALETSIAKGEVAAGEGDSDLITKLKAKLERSQIRLNNLLLDEADEIPSAV